jgi:hypothetical protein
MRDRELSTTEQMTILHQFHQQARDLEQWAGLAASVLANSLHNVALVTQPRTIDVRLKQIQLVELSDNRALLVVVTNDAQVHQRVLEFPVAVQQESLTAGVAAERRVRRKSASELTEHGRQSRWGRSSDRGRGGGGHAAAGAGSGVQSRWWRACAAAEAAGVRRGRPHARYPGGGGRSRLRRHPVRGGGSVAIVIGDENREGRTRT